MVKDLVGKWYNNGVAVTAVFGVGEHRMLGELMSATLYETVSVTPFLVPIDFK